MNEFIEVKYINQKKGRGVFAKKDIGRNTIIERGNVLLIPNKDYDKIYDTILYNYSFQWKDKRYNGEYLNMIPMSICNFINHSYTPNTRYTYDYNKLLIKFMTIKNIKKGEEITTNYNAEPDDDRPVWFEVED